jgi:hypothetical protein
MPEEAQQPPLMDADETMSPVDLPGEEAERPALGWATGVIGGATLFLALTNAASIDGWARELPPGPYAGRATAATGHWLEITDAIGIGAPRATVHGWWKRAEAARFR